MDDTAIIEEMEALHDAGTITIPDAYRLEIDGTTVRLITRKVVAVEGNPDMVAQLVDDESVGVQEWQTST